MRKERLFARLRKTATLPDRFPAASPAPRDGHEMKETAVSIDHRICRFAFALALSLACAAPALAQTLTIGVRAGPESMDPHYTGTGTHAEAMKHVFDTLVTSGDQLQLEP